MSDIQTYWAHKKLHHFFPELKFDTKLLSFFGNEKRLEITLPNTIKGIAMDFTHEVFFKLQIFLLSQRSSLIPHGKSSLTTHVGSYEPLVTLNKKEKFFTEPGGADSNSFYSFQPGIHTHWISHVNFIPPDCITYNQMRVEIPWLKQNGMGLFLFEKEELIQMKENKVDNFMFCFENLINTPKQFTIYVFY